MSTHEPSDEALPAFQQWENPYDPSPWQAFSAGWHAHAKLSSIPQVIIVPDGGDLPTVEDCEIVEPPETGGRWVCGNCGRAPAAHVYNIIKCIYDPVFKPARGEVEIKAEGFAEAKKLVADELASEEARLLALGESLEDALLQNYLGGIRIALKTLENKK